MSRELYDAAFKTLSPSLEPERTIFPEPKSDDDRILFLKSHFRDVPQVAIQDAFLAARQLELTAIRLAEESRDHMVESESDASTWETLEKLCPGFSGVSYAMASSDGFLLTRKATPSGAPNAAFPNYQSPRLPGRETTNVQRTP